MDDWLGLPNISDATTKNDVSTTGNPGVKKGSITDRLQDKRDFKENLKKFNA